MATNIKFHRITATSGSNIKTDQDYVKGDVYFIKSATGNTGKVYICTVAGKGTAATLEDYSVDTNTWRPVVNNLTSTSTDSSLSAAMGKSLSDSITSLNSTLASHTHTFASLTSKPTTLAGYGITEADGYLNKISKSGNTLTITPKDGTAFTFTNTTYSRKWDDNLSNTDYPGYGDAVADALDTSFSLVNVGDMKRWNKASYMLEGLETLLASI